ncbi:MAG TPA: hypothetical protein DHW39_00580 [Erysipelotrichaceae bacterium]|nr:hypothetical protein [Erysipelotrichaceae bacterium]
MKNFKTAKDQALLLQSRGINIPVDFDSERFLITRNYYSMINGYGKYFTSSTDVYLNGVTLREIEKVFIFDKAIKEILFVHLLEVEKYLKAILSYYFCLECPGQYDYLNIQNYKCASSEDRLRSVDVINRIAKVINDYSKKQTPNAIKHYIKVHNGVPLWVAIQFMYFGDVIKMYDCCSSTIQSNVSKEFSRFLKDNTQNSNAFIQPKDLSQILKQMRDIRNAVAHNNQILHFPGSNSIPYIPSIHSPLHIAPSTSRTSMYHTMLAMQCLISSDEYNHLIKSLKKRFTQFKKDLTSIDYNKITSDLGYPKDWINTI